MSLILPALLLAAGAATLAVTFRVAKKALPDLEAEIEDALERVQSSPNGRVNNVPMTAAFAVGLTVGVVLMAIALLWLVAALLLG